MDVTYIKRSLDHILASAGDDESAHSSEDALRDEFIQFIAWSDEVPQHISDMAAQVLTSNEFNFQRWCA